MLSDSVLVHLIECFLIGLFMLYGTFDRHFIWDVFLYLFIYVPIDAKSTMKKFN